MAFKVIFGFMAALLSKAEGKLAEKTTWTPPWQLIAVVQEELKTNPQFLGELEKFFLKDQVDVSGVADPHARALLTLVGEQLDADPSFEEHLGSAMVHEAKVQRIMEAQAAFSMPFGARTFGRTSAASRSAGTSMADDVMATTASLEGPVIYWGSEGPPVGKDESDIKGHDNFGSFVAALEKAGLDKELKGAGPFTVFAPSDAALAAFKGEVTPELLKYHIVPGKISSSALSSADLKTLNGKALTYKRFARKDFVDDAMVGVKSAGASKGQNFPCDVEASNGVVHSLNSVLEP